MLKSIKSIDDIQSRDVFVIKIDNQAYFISFEKDDTEVKSTDNKLQAKTFTKFKDAAEVMKQLRSKMSFYQVKVARLK